LITESKYKKQEDLINFLWIIYLEIQSSLNGESVEAILNVAGGWAGGNAGNKGKSKIIYLF
jgi:hypothetical protein